MKQEIDENIHKTIVAEEIRIPIYEVRKLIKDAQTYQLFSYLLMYSLNTTEKPLLSVYTSLNINYVDVAQACNQTVEAVKTSIKKLVDIGLINIDEKLSTHITIKAVTAYFQTPHVPLLSSDNLNTNLVKSFFVEDGVRKDTTEVTEEVKKDRNVNIFEEGV